MELRVLTEQDYREVLEDLGFDMEATPQPNTGRVGRSLRHSIRRFVGIPGRIAHAFDAFWPTLYWNRNGDLIYFSTTRRDHGYFSLIYWERAPSDRVLPHEQKAGTYCFVPFESTRSGLRTALESLFLARHTWGSTYRPPHIE